MFYFHLAVIVFDEQITFLTFLHYPSVLKKDVSSSVYLPLPRCLLAIQSRTC